MLRSNPHLGHQFRLRSCFRCLSCIPFELFLFLSFDECNYYISSSYLSENIKCILYTLLIILFLVIFEISFFFIITVSIISFILLPWYHLSGLIFLMNIDLSMAYYRDMFGSNPDLDPPVIIDEMSDKLRSIVDNYTPLPSTTSFDYLRFVNVSGGERERVLNGSFIEFIKYA